MQLGFQTAQGPELDKNAQGKSGEKVAWWWMPTHVDLRGTRLALPAHYVAAPGTFLTRLLQDAGQPLDRAFFGQVTLPRYSKDAVIDVLKGRADVACVDQGTIGGSIDFVKSAGILRAQIRRSARKIGYHLMGIHGNGGRWARAADLGQASRCPYDPCQGGFSRRSR